MNFVSQTIQMHLRHTDSELIHQRKEQIGYSSKISLGAQKNRGARGFRMFPRKLLQKQPLRAPSPLARKGATRESGDSRANCGTGSLPFLAEPPSQPGLQPRSGSPSSRLHFSLPLLSGSRAPQTGFLPRLSGQRRARPPPLPAPSRGPADPSSPAAATPRSDTESAGQDRPPAVAVRSRAAYMVDAVSRFPLRKTPASVSPPLQSTTLPVADFALCSPSARRSDQMLRQRESSPDRVVLVSWAQVRLPQPSLRKPERLRA